MKKAKLITYAVLFTMLVFTACTGEEKTGTDKGETKGSSAVEETTTTKAEVTIDQNHVKDENGFERNAKGYIISYEGKGGDIEIPSSIVNVDITGIGANVFSGNQTITSVKIPKSVTLIDGSAFKGCSSLRKVEFSEGLLEISNSAFYDCPLLTDVKLPESCSFVGMDAFYGSGKGTFTGSKAAYGDRCFAASSYESIILPSGSDVSSIEIFREAQAKKIVLPQDLNALGESAFSKCSNISEIILPDSVRSIGEYCFAGIRILPKLRLPEGIEELPKNMTSGTALDVLIIPESVKKICQGAVYDAAIVIIKNPVVEIEQGGISGGYVYIKNANEFVFPEMEDDESSIIADKICLDKIYSPSDIQGNFYSSVTAGSYVLLPCDATIEESDALDKWLLSIGYEEIAWMASTPEEFIPESTMDFDMDGENITGYHGDSDIISIPQYVKFDDGGFWFNALTVTVKDKAFAGSDVKTVYVPGNITIGHEVFSGCEELEDIWFSNALISNSENYYYEEDSFSGIPEDVTIHLPESVDMKEAEETLRFIGIPDNARIEYYTEK
ncbi:hypothetical protein UYO_2160 [Lachnospiraceae bacterium JC7]|nr:hypothetical protein UYO_2160 [Lachnospiraceae bacterium JC7]